MAGEQVWDESVVDIETFVINPDLGQYRIYIPYPQTGQILRYDPTADGGGFSGCSSPHTTDPLPDGEHTFEVRALNPAAKPDPTPAFRTFTVDTLALHLRAKKQALRKRLTFFATANVDSTMVAIGKAIKKTTTALASNQETKVQVKLKRATRERLQKKLDEKGKAKVKITATVARGIFDFLRLGVSGGRALATYGHVIATNDSQDIFVDI